MAFDFLNSLASQSLLSEIGDIGDESDIDLEVETEREPELDPLDKENDDTGPQPLVTSE